MTVQEAITKVTGIISNPKVEDGGVTTEGRFSAEECNAIVTVLNSLLTIDGHTNVDKADGLVLNDYVLVKKAYSSTWEAKTLASVRQAVDSTVRQGSANPVSSNAVYRRIQDLVGELSDELSQKQDVVDIDDVPTENSDNLVKSSGIKEELDKKQDKLVFDEEPIANSKNPITSGAIYSIYQSLISELASRLSSNDIAQESGNSTTLLMSQKAVTDAIHLLMVPSYKYVSVLPTASQETSGELYICPKENELAIYITENNGGFYLWNKIGSLYQGGSGTSEGEYYES